MLNQHLTPYADAIASAAATPHDTRLMVPGHQNSPEHPLTRVLGSQILAADIPPLIHGIDKGSNSPLQQSLTLAAEAFHAKKTWFLTNGASQGNRMLGIALGHYAANGKVLAQRSTHSSFIDGMIIGGVDALFLNPSVDYNHGIHHGLTPEQIEHALQTRKDIKAVYLISPSYFGAVTEIETIAGIVHRAGLPLIVDGSWGSHFGFAPELPANPLTLGADVLVSSMHKLGGSLTQSAMLHLGHGPHAHALEPLLTQAFHLTQSTSASGLLMASLDIARADLATNPEALAEAVHRANNFRNAIRASAHLAVASDTFTHPDILTTDPLHLAIDITGLGRTGYDMQCQLQIQHNIYVELATTTCIVLILGTHHTYDIARIIDALESLHTNQPPTHEQTFKLPAMSESSMSIRDAYYSDTEIIHHHDAIGRISADSLAAYPPGIPNILPGEIITADIINFLRYTAATEGGYVRGAQDPHVNTFRVVK